MTIYDEFDLDVEYRLANQESLLDHDDPLDLEHHLNHGLLYYVSCMGAPQLSGTDGRVFDIANRSHGQFKNSATFTAARTRPGGLGSFNIGNGTYHVQVPDQNPWLRPSRMSAGCWFRLNSVGGGVHYHHLFMKLNQSGWASPYASYAIRVNNTANLETWVNNAGLFPANYATDSGTVTTNRWYHAMMTHDGSTLRLYLDGTQVATKAIASDVTTYSADHMLIGNAGDIAANSSLDGFLDELRIYDRVLNAAEINELRNENLLGNPKLWAWKRRRGWLSVPAQSGVSADLPVVVATVTSVAPTANHDEPLPAVQTTVATIAPTVPAESENDLPAVAVTVAAATPAVAAVLPSVTISIVSTNTFGQNRVNFYLTTSTASGSNHLVLQMGGSAPATATTGTGWTVGTTAAGQWSYMAAGVERAAATFASSAPTPVPDNTLGNCFRTNALTGKFDAGLWRLTIPVIAVTSGGDQGVRINYAIRVSANATGSGSTLLTSGFASTANNLTTATPQEIISDLQAVDHFFTNEYMFLVIQVEVTTPGGAADRDVLIRVGSNAGILATGFTTGFFASLSSVVVSVTSGTPSMGQSQDLPSGVVTVTGITGTIDKAEPLPQQVVSIAAPALAQQAHGIGPVAVAVSAPAVATANTSAPLDSMGISVTPLAPAATHDEPLGPVTVTVSAPAVNTDHLEALTPQAITVTSVSPNTSETIDLPAASFAVAGVQPNTDHLEPVTAQAISVQSVQIIGERRIDLPSVTTILAAITPQTTHLEDLATALVTVATIDLRGVVAHIGFGTVTFLFPDFAVIKAELLPGIVQAITAPSPTVDELQPLPPARITVRVNGLMGEPDPERIGDVLCATILPDRLDASIETDRLESTLFPDRLACAVEPGACDC